MAPSNPVFDQVPSDGRDELGIVLPNSADSTPEPLGYLAIPSDDDYRLVPPAYSLMANGQDPANMDQHLTTEKVALQQTLAGSSEAHTGALGPTESLQIQKLDTEVKDLEQQIAAKRRIQEGLKDLAMQARREKWRQSVVDHVMKQIDQAEDYNARCDMWDSAKDYNLACHDLGPVCFMAGIAFGMFISYIIWLINNFR